MVPKNAVLLHLTLQYSDGNWFGCCREHLCCWNGCHSLKYVVIRMQTISIKLYPEFCIGLHGMAPNDACSAPSIAPVFGWQSVWMMLGASVSLKWEEYSNNSATRMQTNSINLQTQHLQQYAIRNGMALKNAYYDQSHVLIFG